MAKQQEIKITVRYVEPTEQDRERVRHYMNKFWTGLWDEFENNPERLEQLQKEQTA